jgi:hypothetical protein
MIMDQKSPDKEVKVGEGLGGKHPYLIYLVLVLVLFLFLILMGYLAIENEWLPSRGIHSS